MGMDDVSTVRILNTVQFQACSRTFATLGWPEAGRPLLRLSAGGQESASARRPAAARKGRAAVTASRVSSSGGSTIPSTMNF